MKNYLVQLLSKRRHYDVAAILHQGEVLSKLVTDFYSHSGHFPLESIISIALSADKVTKFQSYYNPVIDDSKVTSAWDVGFYFRYLLSKYPMNYVAYEKASSLLAKRTIREMNLSKTANSIYGYDVTALEAFREAKERDFYVVLEQCVAPRKAQIEMYDRFASLYGINVTSEIDNCKKLQDREQEEWQIANKILAPSSYVSNKLQEAGVPIEKIDLVPYGFDLKRQSQFKSYNELIEGRMMKKDQNFRVLFVGNSSLRKGIQDIAKIADMVKGDNIEFRIAGRMEQSVLEKFNLSGKKNISFLGMLEKKELFNEYSNADVFILPSYLEGSAMVTLEALNFGLPVIVTKESGSPIINNVHGFEVDAGDLEGLTKAIMDLYTNPEKRFKMAEEIKGLLPEVGLDRYQQNLLKALQ